ncbi:MULTISPECIES: RluA family pseudouridine synthase [Nostocales]|jgi:tRNA pseudouridine32 synthase/23S rRNA pseudouridine746 synthase|uniref:RluA family pseudouridine synthase n=1 Tax=Dolichospermum flos-aquae UHCC 0037 TaxID=2590026 RepID=A0ACC7S489_DOLFA|nr:MULTISPECIES: RluA family pseudouridine synthase [Nostocales]MBO1072302.1 RluA family pseudouridine synthase [Dolichospermum sp. DEX189]MCX5983081.1 pseudouridine synthase [Nostocales cyanobacterium LacPavin_0920_SED1_MAG_38_18]MBO1067698.1 RluA family pseudouridine synthase [Anabaena sp. 54]MTJ43184.1 RluA family pseudouridine synthase [Dolichospermum flos-aquae UHCC 0037]OBQ17076.1 MAG: pseudouridine synthase [Anabaena sp. AL93]
MIYLHPLSDFISSNLIITSAQPNYYYEGKCPQTGEILRLPRTPLAEAIANNLMQQLEQNHLYSQEGKMYGILLVELPNGEPRVIKAFSGLLNGNSMLKGWVSPIPGREEVVLLETQTLAKLEAIKQEIISLEKLSEREEYKTLSAEYTQQLQALSLHHYRSKLQRQTQRQEFWQTLTDESLKIALEQLETESRLQGIERRHLKRRQNEILQPLQKIITSADQKIAVLKQQRKQLSRHLQTEMHAAYSLTNFQGQSLSLQQLLPTGTPTGTGECCAPKLLHYAATHQLKPLAMAEFWWGNSTVEDKIQGEFYGACLERCQPLMGFLLSGLKPNQVEIIYEDEWLIAVNKSSGLLSVPGRYFHNQDSVISRLRHLYNQEIIAVHRLDQDTSGILLIAKDPVTYSQISKQFQKRQVSKVYEALLTGSLAINEGEINLPLWGNPDHRPYQEVDLSRGKPSLTHFRVMNREGDYTRVEFVPLTGRTHQLRVHAADTRGLGMAILGDKLYGYHSDTDRLYLHARELRFQHPHVEKIFHLQVKTPF